MNANVAFLSKEYNPKLIIIGALFLGYGKLKLKRMGNSISIERSSMYYKNCDIMEKLIIGFIRTDEI